MLCYNSSDAAGRSDDYVLHHAPCQCYKCQINQSAIYCLVCGPVIALISEKSRMGPEVRQAHIHLTTYMKAGLVGRYRKQQNGIGRGFLFFRVRAASAEWPDPVEATY